MDLTQIVLWAQVGEQLIKLGVTSVGHLREAMAAGSLEADQATLARLETLYDERIARAEADARGEK